MITNYFQLSNSDKSSFVNILKMFFGIACIAVGIYWAIHMVNASGSGGTEWITILFLLGFGFYEIWSALGKAEKYIEIDETFIRLKKSVFLPARHIEMSEIKKIEIFPLKIDFLLKNKTKIALRLGTTYVENNEKIIDALVKFAKQNAIDVDLL